MDYDFDLELFSVSAILNYHPWQGGFHISAGALYNDNKLDIKAKPSGGSFDFNGTNYTAEQVGTADGEITFNQFAPYIGVGWLNNNSDSNWLFNADLGLAYQGSPKAKLRASGGLLADDQTFKDNVAAEERQLQGEVDGLKWYPVISFGLSYRF